MLLKDIAVDALAKKMYMMQIFAFVMVIVVSHSFGLNFQSETKTGKSYGENNISDSTTLTF